MGIVLTGEAAAGGAGGMMSIVIVYAAVLLIGWFLLIRPNQKERKRVQGMLAEMAVGDTVVTTSGFYGVVIDITDDDVIVEFGNNKNCRIPMQKGAIALVEKASNGYEKPAKANESAASDEKSKDA